MKNHILYISWKPSVARTYAKHLGVESHDEFVCVGDRIITYLPQFSLYIGYPALELQQSKKMRDAIRTEELYLPELDVNLSDKMGGEQMRLIFKLIEKYDIKEVVLIAEKDLGVLWHEELIKRYLAPKDIVVNHILLVDENADSFELCDYEDFINLIEAGEAYDMVRKIMDVQLSKMIKMHYNHDYKNSATLLIGLGEAFLLNKTAELDGEKNNVGRIILLAKTLDPCIRRNGYSNKWFDVSAGFCLNVIEQDLHLIESNQNDASFSLTSAGVRINKIVENYAQKVIDAQTYTYWLNRIDDIADGRDTKENVIDEAIEFAKENFLMR